MKIKTSELTGSALDWAVAKCEGYFETSTLPHGSLVTVSGGVCILRYRKGDDNKYSPSTAWDQGGPIIEREFIDVAFYPGEAAWSASMDMRNDDGIAFQHFAETPLIAAMRCYVASKLGDEVDVPEELT
jgi:hypothetical protein